MADITSPIALDESFNTTETTPRNIADVVADETGDLVTQAQAIVTKLQGIISAVKPDASDIPLDPITGMSATNVQSGISELKGTLDDLFKRVDNQTGTTDANGNIAISKPAGAALDIVLFGWNNQHIFMPFYYNGSWYFRVTKTDATGTAVTNQSITYSYFYIGT